jgi:hypothetical protein
MMRGRFAARSVCVCGGGGEAFMWVEDPLAISSLISIMTWRLFIRPSRIPANIARYGGHETPAPALAADHRLPGGHGPGQAGDFM